MFAMTSSEQQLEMVKDLFDLFFHFIIFYFTYFLYYCVLFVHYLLKRRFVFCCSITIFLTLSASFPLSYSLPVIMFVQVSLLTKYGLGTKRTLDQLILFTGVDVRASIVFGDRCKQLLWVPFTADKGEVVPNLVFKLFNSIL